LITLNNLLYKVTVEIRYFASYQAIFCLLVFLIAIS